MPLDCQFIMFCQVYTKRSKSSKVIIRHISNFVCDDPDNRQLSTSGESLRSMRVALKPPLYLLETTASLKENEACHPSTIPCMFLWPAPPQGLRLAPKKKLVMTMINSNEPLSSIAQRFSQECPGVTEISVEKVTEYPPMEVDHPSTKGGLQPRIVDYRRL